MDSTRPIKNHAQKKHNKTKEQKSKKKSKPPQQTKLKKRAAVCSYSTEQDMIILRFAPSSALLCSFRILPSSSLQRSLPWACSDSWPVIGGLYLTTPPILRRRISLSRIVCRSRKICPLCLLPPKSFLHVKSMEEQTESITVRQGGMRCIRAERCVRCLGGAIRRAEGIERVELQGCKALEYFALRQSFRHGSILRLFSPFQTCSSRRESGLATPHWGKMWGFGLEVDTALKSGPQRNGADSPAVECLRCYGHT